MRRSVSTEERSTATVLRTPLLKDMETVDVAARLVEGLSMRLTKIERMPVTFSFCPHSDMIPNPGRPLEISATTVALEAKRGGKEVGANPGSKEVSAYGKPGRQSCSAVLQCVREYDLTEIASLC